MALDMGEVAPPLTLPTVHGELVTVDPSAATATVVIWTCNHCPYALAWHDRIQNAIRSYAGRDVQFFQINANDAAKNPVDGTEGMRQRIDAGEFASPYLRDEEQSASKRWGARVTPDVFVLDSDGLLRYRGAPDDDYADEAQEAAHMRAAVDELLAGAPVSQPYVKPVGCGVKWIVNDQPNPHAD